MVLVKVTEEMKNTAEKYANLSNPYTSRDHDFHEGGPDEASKKMYIGKVGEKAFAYWLDINNISYIEDISSHNEPDNYDFIIDNLKIDVKTRSESFHIRTFVTAKLYYAVTAR